MSSGRSRPRRSKSSTSWIWEWMPRPMSSTSMSSVMVRLARVAAVPVAVAAARPAAVAAAPAAPAAARVRDLYAPTTRLDQVPDLVEPVVCVARPATALASEVGCIRGHARDLSVAKGLLKNKLDITQTERSSMLTSDLRNELRTLETETFEVVDLVDLGMDAASDVVDIDEFGNG